MAFFAAFVAPELAQAIAAATARLPPYYCLLPVENEIVEGRDLGIQRIQDWAFTQGFAVAIGALVRII
jgi:hypothetical protein